MVPRRRRAAPRDRLTIAAGVSTALHVALLAALIITFPNKTPPEPPPTNAVSVVFEPGQKTPTAPKTVAKQNQQAREAAPRGKQSPTPQRTVQASPPPAPLPRPEIKTPEPPHPVAPPKPVTPPVPKPPAPKPVPVAPKPPPPPLPKINLPPPPPPAPAAPKTPVPKPAPVPLPSVLTDNTPAEVNLNLPPMPELAPIPLPEPPPPLPPIPPAPQQAAPARRSGKGRSSVLSQGVMMNGMSFSGGGSTSGGRSRGLNLQLPSSMQANPGSDLAIQGSPGKNWLSELQQWVNDRASYPDMAGEMGQQGSVTVRFTVDRAGHVSRLMMVTPTGYALLDQSWLGLFRDADLPPLGSDAKTDTVTVTATMHYEIVH